MDQAPSARSYTSTTRGLVSVVREAAYQVRDHVWSVRNADGLAQGFIRNMQDDAEIAEEVFGRRIEGLDVLDVGTGAIASQALYFACRNNRVTSIDLEQQSTATWDPRLYLDLYRQNGPRRALKTLARRIIGLDRAFPRAMARRMGQREVPRMDLLRMDAANMSFPDASFDVVHSYDVIEHVSDVEGVIREIARVVRPGGLAYFILMPYTCENGAHDFRQLSGRRGDLPYWAHLRPQHAAAVQPSAYVNKLGLREVQAICDRHMPGATFRAPPAKDPTLPDRLRELRAAGELAGYTDEELLAVRLQVFWRKPAG